MCATFSVRMPCRLFPAQIIMLFSVAGILTLPAANYPLARILPGPGFEYADENRVWQGIPGIERAANGRLWVTWYSGDEGEGAMGNYVLVSTASGF